MFELFLLRSPAEHSVLRKWMNVRNMLLSVSHRGLIQSDSDSDSEWGRAEKWNLEPGHLLRIALLTVSKI